jgi:hypothetical protein
MQQVRRPIVCASFGESNPLSAIPGLTALKSSPGMPIVTGYGRELPDHLSHRRRASRDNDLQDRDTGKTCIDKRKRTSLLARLNADISRLLRPTFRKRWALPCYTGAGIWIERSAGNVCREKRLTYVFSSGEYCTQSWFEINREAAEIGRQELSAIEGSLNDSRTARTVVTVKRAHGQEE